MRYTITMHVQHVKTVHGTTQQVELLSFAFHKSKKKLSATTVMLWPSWCVLES